MHRRMPNHQVLPKKFFTMHSGTMPQFNQLWSLTSTKKLFKVSFFLDIAGVDVKYEHLFWLMPNLLSLSAVEGFQNEATNPIQHEKSFVIIFLPWFYDYGSQTSSLCQNICENFFGHTWFLYTCLPNLVFHTFGQ